MLCNVLMHQAHGTMVRFSLSSFGPHSRAFGAGPRVNTMLRGLEMTARGTLRGKPGLRLSSSWAVGKTIRSNARKAVAVCVNDVQDELLGEVPALCLAQLGHRHDENAKLLSEAAEDRLRCRAILGCTGEEGAGSGASGATGMSLAAIGLPEGNQCNVYHFPDTKVPPEAGSSVEAASDLVVVGGHGYELSELFEDVRLHRQAPKESCGIVGGLQVPTSDGRGVRLGLVLAGTEWHETGAGVAAITGKRLKTLVSYGCSPVGEMLEVLEAKRGIVEQVVRLGETKANDNKAVIDLYCSLEKDNLLKDGTSVILGTLDEEAADEDDPASYTLYKVVEVSPKTGEMRMETLSWDSDDFNGKKCRFFVQTKALSAADYERTLSAFPYSDLPQSGAFLFSGHSRMAQEEEHAFTQQHLPGMPIAQVVTKVTIVPRPLPYATCTASVLAWWE